MAKETTSSTATEAPRAKKRGWYTCSTCEVPKERRQFSNNRHGRMKVCRECWTTKMVASKRSKAAQRPAKLSLAEARAILKAKRPTGRRSRELEERLRRAEIVVRLRNPAEAERLMTAPGRQKRMNIGLANTALQRSNRGGELYLVTNGTDKGLRTRSQEKALSEVTRLRLEGHEVDCWRKVEVHFSAQLVG